MERRPTGSVMTSTATMQPRRRQWRGTAPTTATNNPPRPVNAALVVSESLRPAVVPIPIVAMPPASLANCPQVDIQSLLSGQLSSETRRAYRGDIKHFLTFISHPEAVDDMTALPMVLAHVDRQTAAAYRDHMMTVEKRSAATVNRRLATVNVIYNALCEKGIIAKNPFSWVKRPKLSNIGGTPAFTKEQAEAILSMPDISTPQGERDRILMLLLFFAGLRRGEVIKVETDDFFQSQGHILLRIHGKGRSDKSDVVLIPDSIWPDIQDYAKDREGLLFTAQSRNTTYNRTDKPLSANRVYLLFKKYCRMAGIDADAYSPHSTRATFITLCLTGNAAGNADIRQTAYAARHSSVNTTLRYDRQRMNLENHASKYLDIRVRPEQCPHLQQPK